MNFVLQHRLSWTHPIRPAAAPFQDPADLKILWNDWPYGIDPKIVHLVVWTKFELEEDPNSPTGDLSARARREIEDFVDKTFSAHVGKENVSSPIMALPVCPGHVPAPRLTRKDYEDITNKTQVAWFKNWRALKSVHAVEHFHVMLYNPDQKFLDELTGGDVPLSKKLAEAE
jgi:hypothetical protein